MAKIDLVGVRHAYGSASASGGGDDASANWALKTVNLMFEDGGAYALLGPSGCGKTTLLNIMSGLVTPTEGQVLIDGRDVTHAPTEARNIAQVFQFPVIYDTMTVRENLAFPLRNRGVKRAEANARADEMLAMIGLAAKGRRRARGLTADDKQKISLGRGLIRPDVAAILFDEPLTVIDPAMKWELRAKLRELHTRAPRTMIYVTHDQTEALTFADTVAVMHAGEVVQLGSPADLFERPEHTFVGHFIGSPGMNILPVTLDGDAVRLGAQRIAHPAAAQAPKDARLELGVRPEHVRIGGEGLPARVLRVEDAGRLKIVRMEAEGARLSALIDESSEIPADPRVSFDGAFTHLYADERRVRPEAEARG